MQKFQEIHIDLDDLYNMKDCDGADEVKANAAAVT